MIEKNITTKIQVFAYDELNEEDRRLVEMACEATKASYAPYSNYHVGAALLLDNGEYFIGANQENAAFAGICGERSAIYAAGAQYPGVPVKKLAITAAQDGEIVAEPVAPCGVCRQVMSEFCKDDFVVICAKSEDEYRVNTLTEVLPDRFGPKDLLD